MRYFTNFYIICNTDTFGLDFKKIITDFCKFHTICLHFDDFENSFHTFNPNDIVFIYLQSKEETQKTYRILEDVDFNSEVFLYSPTYSLFLPFHKKNTYS